MSDDLVNRNRVTILKGDPVKDFRLDGAVNRYPDYTFTAKVYDVGTCSASETDGSPNCRPGAGAGSDVLRP
jgi:hypothetical protein